MVNNLIWQDAKSASFFELTAQLGYNLPFKRTLSLMRLMECEEYCWEKSTWSEKCSNSFCGDRYKSCQNYITNLHYYHLTLDKKICHRFLFRKVENNSTKIIGYCIIHEDKFKENSNSHFYLTECVIANPKRELKGYAYGNYVTQIPFGSNKFTIKGNYFSQQNRNTNCCAQAAIKMVLRGYYNNISCEEINLAAGVRHDREEGKKGFRVNQTCIAIENFSNKSACSLKPSVLIADSADPGRFLKHIYHAIESKFPVILFMILPKASQFDKTKGHAVALIGHSFEPNNWAAYGGGYFSENNVGYLSSFLWCNNFIIQDDNFGPFYQLNTKFLREYSDLYRRQLSFSDCAMKRLPLKKDESFQHPPLSAIIIHKEEHKYITQSCIIEEFAADLINVAITSLDCENKKPTNKSFDLYFYDYFNPHNRSKVYGNNNSHQNALILRTLLVSKEEYLDGEVWDIYSSVGIEERVNKILPNYFWMVEISVPELYWINQRKVGEILIDPDIFQNEFAKNNFNLDEPYDESPLLIRLPECLLVYELSKFRILSLPKTQAHQKLLKKKRGFIRVSCGFDSLEEDN